MESLRQELLQAELDKIEAEAQTKSRLIMAKADTLAAAHAFCARFNEGVESHWRCRPTVVYQTPYDTCEIIVFPPNSRVFLRRCRDLGFVLCEAGPKDGPYRPMSIDALPGVQFLLT
jgi:hypothetical protein